MFKILMMLAASTIMAVPVVFGGAAAAWPAMPPGTVSREIHITARVAPAQYIEVDVMGEITKIISNTTEDVMPRVFFEAVGPGAEVALTPEILESYRKLVPQGASRAGILYERGSPAAILGVRER